MFAGDLQRPISCVVHVFVLEFSHDELFKGVLVVLVFVRLVVLPSRLVISFQSVLAWGTLPGGPRDLASSCEPWLLQPQLDLTVTKP